MIFLDFLFVMISNRKSMSIEAKVAVINEVDKEL